MERKTNQTVFADRAVACYLNQTVDYIHSRAGWQLEFGVVEINGKREAVFSYYANPVSRVQNWCVIQNCGLAADILREYEQALRDESVKYAGVWYPDASQRVYKRLSESADEFDVAPMLPDGAMDPEAAHWSKE